MIFQASSSWWRWKMISFKEVKNIHLYRQIVDVRKGIDGYIALVSDCGMDPYNGDLYLFCNRKEDRMKGIIYDGVSFWLLYRRLNEGRLQWKRDGDGIITISHKQLKRLLNGMHIDYSGNYKPTYPQYG